MVLNGIGFIMEDAPKTNNILKIFEPTIFPTTKSTSFFIAAITHTINSGKDVPNAKTVAEIKNSEAPNCFAISIAESITNLPPIVNPINPPRIIVIIMGIECLTGSNSSGINSLSSLLCLNKNAKKTPKSNISIIPSILDKTLTPLKNESFNIKNKNKIVNKVKGIPFLTIFFLTLTLIINAVIPNINRIFAILLPIILPKDMSVVPFIEENILTTNSGNDVPNAITVKPRIRGFIFISFPKFDDPSTK